MLDEFLNKAKESFLFDIRQIIKEELGLHSKSNGNSLPVAEEKLLSRKEVCKILAISEPTLDKLIKEEIVPCHRIGKSIRFKSQEVHNSLIKRKFTYGK